MTSRADPELIETLDLLSQVAARITKDQANDIARTVHAIRQAQPATREGF